MSYQIEKYESSKLYFFEKHKIEMMQILEREQFEIHDRLMSNDAHTNDPEYCRYMKNEYLALADLLHQIIKLYEAAD